MSLMTTSPIMTEHSRPMEINVGRTLKKLAFSSNGKYIVTGGDHGVQVWQVKDGKQMARMATATGVYCLAVSKDGRWIAAVFSFGALIVWDAKTYGRVFSLKDVNGLDFSPDSTRLATTSQNYTAAIWDARTYRRVVGPLRHDSRVHTAKYSPHGDRIATATFHSVRIYDSNDGRFLLDIPVGATQWFDHTGLLWSNDQLFIISDSRIKQVESSTGSMVSEWSVPYESNLCTVLPQHQEFIACSTKHIVTFWATSTHTEFGLKKYTKDIRSIAVSPDDRFLAIGGADGRVTINHLPHITDSIPLPRLRPAFKMSVSSFDDIDITIRQRHCEALYVADRTTDASRTLLNIVNTHGKRVYTSKPLTNWVSDFTQRCLVISDSESDGDVAPKATPPDDLPTLHATPVTPSPLLKEWAKATLMKGSWTNALIAAVGFTAPRSIIYRAICERLETIDHLLDASQCFHQMVSELAGETGMHDELANWVLDFKRRCCGTLENIGDVAADTQRHEVAIIHYSAVLSLSPDCQLFIKRRKSRMAMGLWGDALDDANQVIASELLSPWRYEKGLTKGAETRLIDGSWRDALLAVVDFTVQRFMIYPGISEYIQTIECILDASQCLHQMSNQLATMARKIGKHNKHEKWVLDFKLRCYEKLERFGDAAMDAQRHDEAIVQYSAAIYLNPHQGLFIKRSKARMAKGLWEDALNDANEAIALDESSPWGYETLRAVLHGSNRYVDAMDTFEIMLSKMAQSPDPRIRERHGQYISTRAVIRRIVQRTIRHSPHVLIDTSTGRLHNKAEQAAAFESLPLFNELLSLMATRIDRDRIKREVRQHFRYVMLSHRWEDNEPLFQRVIHMAVYDLDKSPTHDKLQGFCKIVRDAGFNWAWSDTCCIDKQDHFVHQEALVAMFKWYRGSAMTVVFLRGVRSPAKLGDLMRSIWNTRAWTFQEYVAAKIIRFYTEDWAPYLDLEIPNHKESPEIISEMEQATGVSAQQLMALRPGLSGIREKLSLASTRVTTLVEDAAYSLLGIFSVTGIPAIYGEGESALGRLLAYILPGSGDVSILAWTGQSSSYNSCLPARITVYNQRTTPHLPLPIADAEMGTIVTTLRTSRLDLDSALKLYDRLNELPAPWFAGSRMKLPCIAFKLPSLAGHRTTAGRVYRMQTPTFGMVEIKTRQDLSQLKALYLVHPWLDMLLDREDMQSGAFVEGDDDDVEPFSPNIDYEDLSEEEIDKEKDDDDIAQLSWPDADEDDMSDEEMDDDSSLVPEPELPLLSRAVAVDPVPMDKETRALRLVARLGQQFGALLFTTTSTRQRAVVYKRVAADSLITVHMREDVPLTDLYEHVRILDVL